MRNVLVLGSGRSGTSMVAGTLSQAGYFMGDDRIPPRESNEKGFFEDRVINDINERLIAQQLIQRAGAFGRWRRRGQLKRGQRWLATLPLEVQFRVGSRLRKRMGRLTSTAPYCYKDPRFCYTLPAWRPLLRDPAFVCVFRQPAATARSIIKECESQRYLRNVRMTLDRALEIWTCMYTHVLEHAGNGGAWIFLHFDQVLRGDALPKLESLTGAVADATFPEQRLKRSDSSGTVSPRIAQVYQRLCRLADFAI